MKIRHPAVDLESEALVRAVRRDDPSGDRLLEALGAGINWPRLLDLSVRHRVMPLLCARLQSLGERNPAPLEIMARLKTLRRLNEGKNLIMLGKLAEILDIFNRNGIEAIVLKGPVLASTAYGSVAKRQFNDLDILIRLRDIMCAKKLMANLGFRPDKEFTPAQEAAHFRRHNDLGFIDARMGMYIEIHFRLTDTFHRVGLETESLFARREVVGTEGLKLPSMSAEDSLLYLCFHGTYHVWSTLGMICDVAALVASRREWAWDKILEEARKAGLRRDLLLGLALAHDAVGLELPKWVKSKIRGDAVAGELKERVLTDVLPGRPTEASHFERSLFYLKSLERVSAKMAFILMRFLLPSPDDWKAVRLPDSLYVLYVPLRIFRLFSERIIPGLAKSMRRSFRSIASGRQPD